MKPRVSGIIISDSSSWFKKQKNNRRCPILKALYCCECVCVPRAPRLYWSLFWKKRIKNKGAPTCPSGHFNGPHVLSFDLKPPTTNSSLSLFHSLSLSPLLSILSFPFSERATYLLSHSSSMLPNSGTESLLTRGTLSLREREKHHQSLKQLVKVKTRKSERENREATKLNLTWWGPRGACYASIDAAQHIHNLGHTGSMASMRQHRFLIMGQFLLTGRLT